MKGYSIVKKLEHLLEIPKNVRTLKRILNLNLSHIKGISIKDAAVLRKVLNVKTIKDLAKRKINEEEFMNLKFLGINPYDLNVWVFISRVLNKGKIEEYIGPRKISLVGLDNAGKTAILRVLQDKVNIDLFGSLAPTIGVNREVIEKLGFEYMILDMGGQQAYRKDYIQHAEKYFLKVGLLIFVIDVQDPDKFEEALHYLEEIIKIMSILNENPEFLVIIHKVDPDIKEQEDIQSSVLYLIKKVDEILQDKTFQYEITTYSIFNALGDNKSVVRDIRDFLSTDSESFQELKDFVIESLERMMNIVLTFGSTMEERFSKIEESIQNFREWSTYTKTPQPKIPAELPTKLEAPKGFKKLQDTQSLKQSLRAELKELLKMRKIG